MDERKRSYKVHARNTVHKLAHETRDRIFVCSTATPFFTKFEGELLQWVTTFDQGIKTVEDAERYFSIRMVVPKQEFLKKIYKTSLHVVRDDGSYTVPNVVDVRYPLSEDDFPAIGCDCERETCDDIHCVVKRVFDEIVKRPKDKHFVVSYRYDIRENILTIMNNGKHESKTTARKFVWKNMTIIFVVPGDPAWYLTKLRDMYNNFTSSVIMVTNFFFCEGHTLKNVKHMHIIGGFPTYECATMFQALGRVSRLGSHSNVDSAVVKVYMYNGQHYATRRGKAVDRENVIRRAMVRMIRDTPLSPATADGRLSNLLALYATNNDDNRKSEPSADESEIDKLLAATSRFASSKYSYNITGIGMCLIDDSINRYKIVQKQAMRQYLFDKRVKTTKNIRIVKDFMRSTSFGPGEIFLSVLDVTLTGDALVDNIRRHVVNRYVISNKIDNLPHYATSYKKLIKGAKLANMTITALRKVLQQAGLGSDFTHRHEAILALYEWGRASNRIIVLTPVMTR